jgi:hypothetical protein
MRYFASLAILSCLALSAEASGPSNTGRLSIAPARRPNPDFAGNVIGLQLPRGGFPVAPKPFLNLQHLKMVLCPQRALADWIMDIFVDWTYPPNDWPSGWMNLRN